MAPSKRWLGAAAFGAAWLGATTAGAYCRTTTCSADDPSGCNLDASGCATEGVPLYWPTQCIGFGIQKSGSPLRNISYATFERILGAAYAQWSGTTCGGGGHPSFGIWQLDPIDCDVPEYNPCLPNSSTWMFRDSSWPYAGAAATLALTTVTFQKATGKILDADVEVNSYANRLSTAEAATVSPGSADLQSIVTHEAGHFLGLAHSSDRLATMYYAYSAGDLSFRTLADDDHAGICDIYPPEQAATACSGAKIVNGFSRSCGGVSPSAQKCAPASGGGSTQSGGCSIGPAPRGSSPWAALALSVLVLGGARPARRRARG